VFTEALVLSIPGVALAAGAATALLSPTRGLVWAGVALLLVSSAVSVGNRLNAREHEDWRALAAAVKRVTDELRHQYVLAFESSPHAGMRRLEVRMRRPELKVKSRNFYRALD